MVMKVRTNPCFSLSFTKVAIASGTAKLTDEYSALSCPNFKVGKFDHVKAPASKHSLPTFNRKVRVNLVRAFRLGFKAKTLCHSLRFHLRSQHIYTTENVFWSEKPPSLQHSSVIQALLGRIQQHNLKSKAWSI